MLPAQRSSSVAVVAVLLGVVFLAPGAAAQTISGYSTVVRVTDQDKHTAPTERDVTYLHYSFEFAEKAPNPEASLQSERVHSAWLLLNVAHQYHTGQLFVRNVVEDNNVVYKVVFNGMTILYQTHLHVEDAGWSILQSIKDGTGVKGRVVVEYRVYDHNGLLMAEERDEEEIRTLQTGVPDSRLWIIYENGTLSITPDFTAHGLLARYTQPKPPDSPGRVEVHNVTYESLELEIIAEKTLQNVKLGYGFGKSGHEPGYTIGSFLGDVATSIGGLLGNVIDKLLDFIFKFLPHGDKLLVAKEYLIIVWQVMWEVFVQEPVLLVRAVFIFALGYGLLLFIDPMFLWLFKPIWIVARVFWKSLTFLWDLFMKIAAILGGKLTGG